MRTEGLQRLIEARAAKPGRIVGFVVADSDLASALRLVEQPLDRIAPAFFSSVVQDEIAPVACCGDHHLDPGCYGRLAASIGITAEIG